MLSSRATKMAQRNPTLAWVTAVWLLQVAMAEHPRWSLKGKPQVFMDLTPFEIKMVHKFLMDKENLELQPSETPTLAKNSVYLMEMLLPKKKDVLDFLDRGKRSPVREARVVIFFGAQEHPNVTEFAVGPLPLPIYMREIAPLSEHHPSWVSRPISKAEYRLIHQTLKKATEPLDKFFIDITNYSLKDCDQNCLTFTYMAPQGIKPGRRSSWFILQRYMAGHFLKPTGLQILLDHGSTDAQDWRVERVWYNGKLYSSPEELAQKYENGEVATVVIVEPLGKDTEQPRLSPINVAEQHLPPYNIEDNTVYYRDWVFSFRLRPSSGMQVLNVHFRGVRIAYEVSVQEAVAQLGGHLPAGIQPKYMDVGWGPDRVTHQLVQGVDCPDTATFLEVIHHYDTDEPVSYPQALCLFEIPAGIPITRHFDSDLNSKSSARMKERRLVLRTTSTVHHYDYTWDFIFYPDGAMETQMEASGLVQSTFYQPEEMNYFSQPRTHRFSNIHTHLVHYRIDLDVAGIKNSFQSLQIIGKNITKGLRHLVTRDTVKQTNYSRGHQAAFLFGKPLPNYLLFSNLHRSHHGHRNSYELQIYSKVHRVELPGWKKKPGLSWARYPLAVTKYRYSERCSSSIYNQYNPWNPPVAFKNFIRNNTNIEDKDLVTWVTVGFHNIADSKVNLTTSENSAGFVLRPFDFFHGS
ncbi:diamine oxidase [copper-containing]-like [Microtus pennsylvanicus]|uniref:diamine oxidase [copper-containing]-like n=1 Tax=Microtus pennsylvanicus TaxID=10058 RepID=UPI003F6C56C2